MRGLVCFLLVALTDGQLVALFKAAMDKARCSNKQAYTDMGISVTQFSKQMNGTEPPRFLSRIWKIENREVSRWFFFLGSLAAGAPKDVKRGVPLVLAMLAQKRMARATLHTHRFIQQRKVKAS